MNMPRRPWGFRPLGDSFRDEVIGLLALGAGFALGGLIFDDFAAFYGAAVALTLLLIVKTVRHVVRQRRARHQPTPSPGE